MRHHQGRSGPIQDQRSVANRHLMSQVVHTMLIDTGRDIKLIGVAATEVDSECMGQFMHYCPDDGYSGIPIQYDRSVFTQQCSLR